MVDAQKVVLVTGGSSGIGQSTAVEFAKLGYRIAITGRNKELLDATLNELLANCPRLGPSDMVVDRDAHFLAIQADFEDEKQVDLVIPKVIGKFKKLDIVINNAGFTGENLSLMDDDFYQDFQRILQVNLMSSVRIAQLAAPHLVRHTVEDPGILINLSSICERVALKALAYCVSKAGLSMLTKTLANQLEGRPVRVLTVSPGPIKTHISTDDRVLDYMGSHGTLLGRTGLAEEVANLIVFLASDKASYMHGSTVDIDGGLNSKLGSLIFEGIGNVLSK